MTMAATGGAIIDTHGLAKRYGRTDALIDLTLRVEPGEIFGFLGPNGAGKTTAVKLLLGLARATGGSGTVLGAPLGDRAARRDVGYLPELFRYQPWLRAREVLELHARLRSVDGGGSTSSADIDAVAWRGRPGRPGRQTRWVPSRRACSSGWGWPSRCWVHPAWSSSTSRRPPSTRWAAPTSGPSSDAPPRPARPSS